MRIKREARTKKKEQMKRTEKDTADAEQYKKKEVNTIETEHMKEGMETRDQNLKKEFETTEPVAEIGNRIIVEEIKVQGNMKDATEIKSTETDIEMKERAQTKEMETDTKTKR